MQTNKFIANNLKQESTSNYKYTAMVSHMGKPVSFAMQDNGKIFYSVLDMSSQAASSDAKADKNNDKLYWSKVTQASMLYFPQEIMQTGYALVANKRIDVYDSNNRKVISSYNANKQPLDSNGQILDKKTIKNRTDYFYSSTARLTAVAPFQALSDGKYIYIFRQSIQKTDANNIQMVSDNADSSIVDSTLLVDRFVLSGTFLKPGREIRYQRSKHKTEPESKKDTLAATDVEGNPFYEPTRELDFVRNLEKGNFSALLLPGSSAEEKRWQIFSYDKISNKVNSFNIRFDYSLVFDTSDTKTLIDAFITRYSLDKSLITDVQAEIRNNKTDDQIATLLSTQAAYVDKSIPQDAFAEIIYTIRTGVSKDDFTPASAGAWPLIEYTSDGSAVKPEYLESGKVKNSHAFQATAGDKLQPYTVDYTVKNGMSSCYYYQQEMGEDKKPMKNKACVMLAMGIEDAGANKYIAIVNFAVAASGKLS